MKLLFIAAVAVAMVASPAIADMPPSDSGNCNKCGDHGFGKDLYNRDVFLERGTVKRISDLSVEFSYRAGPDRYDSQVRCVGSRLRIYDLVSRKWVPIESPALFRLVGVACEVGGF